MKIKHILAIVALAMLCLCSSAMAATIDLSTLTATDHYILASSSSTVDAPKINDGDVITGTFGGKTKKAY